MIDLMSLRVLEFSMNEIEVAKEEIKRKFEMIAENGILTVAIIQRKLSVGYMTAARFVDEMEEILIVSPVENKVRKIIDKENFIIKGVEYFSRKLVDNDKLNELNGYDNFVFALRDEFDADNVDYYWLVRLISENFAKDDEYVKMIDYVFDSDCLSELDLEVRARKILGYYYLYSPVLSVVTLQYFADKLKYKTLNNNNKINVDFKEKLQKLRFFGKLTEEN
jgi:hypothetical protein